MRVSARKVGRFVSLEGRHREIRTLDQLSKYNPWKYILWWNTVEKRTRTLEKHPPELEYLSAWRGEMGRSSLRISFRNTIPRNTVFEDWLIEEGIQTLKRAPYGQTDWGYMIIPTLQLMKIQPISLKGWPRNYGALHFWLGFSSMRRVILRSIVERVLFPPTLTNAGTYVLVLPHPSLLLGIYSTTVNYFANSETHIFSFDRVLKSSEKVLFPLLTNCVT